MDDPRAGEPADSPAGAGGEPAPERPGLPLPPPPPTRPPERTSGLTFETCYRHPDVQTGVHCTRCGRPICPDCMREAPIGHQCPDCAREARRGSTMVRPRMVIGGTPVVTRALIGANLAVFVIEVAVGGAQSLFSGPTGHQLYQLGALYPSAVASGQYWRLLTMMFLHIGLFHIFFNMWALAVLGPMVEGAFGRTWFVVIYFVTGFLAGVASYTFGYPGSPALGRASGELAAGASGAIFGLFGAWLAFAIRRRHTAFGRAQLNWAVTIIAINAALTFTIHNLDWHAHVGGLIGGLAAGWVAEGFGSNTWRQTLRVLGTVALVAIGVVLLIHRTADLRAAGIILPNVPPP